MAGRSLLNREPKSLDEVYFKRIRPRLYERHGTHAQYGTRLGRSLAEHLDSACQFVLTASQIAEVPERTLREFTRFVVERDM